MSEPATLTDPGLDFAAERLFEPERHTPLSCAPWCEADALDAIRRIAQRCRDELDPQRGWLTHPLDDPETPDERVWPLYHGAAGVVWALRHLADAGALPAHERLHDDALWPVAADRAVAALGDFRHGTASLLLGEVGARLLQWRCSSDAAERARALDRLGELIDGNAANPCCEALWGGPGTVLAAVWLAEATGESRWVDRVRQGAQWLFDAMDVVDRPPAPHGLWAWTQDLYGRRVDYLGGGHGMAGNLFPFARGAAFLPPAQVDEVLARGLATLQALALHGRSPEGRPMLNWGGFRTPPNGPGATKRLVQDCHGASGIVVRLAGAPRTVAWDALLTAAAECVWQAGPLSKGPGLCHGTAGNGFALLKLWQRSGDPLWLERARAFAMHAIGQVDAAFNAYGRGRPSLWTGDPGVACYLWQCVRGEGDFPTLDRF